MRSGLTTTEAREKLLKYGYNELPSAHTRNLLNIAWDVMQEPMFLLLITCGVLYIILGDFREGIIMLSTIFIIIGITFFQSRKSERALEALKKLSSPRTLVIRDGSETRIPGREVVPGDIMIIYEGDRVAADANIVETSSLTIDEALLTGEAFPILKSAETDRNKVYGGTLVIQGKGIAVVTATGIHTRFGQIGLSLKNIAVGETRLQKEMKSLIRTLFIIGSFISISVIAVYYFTRYDFIQSLLMGLAAAMSIIPEEFPVVLTIFLALGAWRLSQKNVLTRNPTAVETLGAATVLCSDKTGTITQNNMEVTAVYDGLQVYDSKVIRSAAITGPLLRAACLASQSNPVDPMEKALHKAAIKICPINDRDLSLVKEYPLSAGLFAMTRVQKNDTTGELHIASKGSPEAIFSLCKMDEKEVNKHLEAARRMAEEGYRVIAVATGSSVEKELPETQQEIALVFCGLIGMEDPIRPEVPQAIRECKEAGIRVIMVTGDFPPTAKSIGARIGLETSAGIITGEELNTMDEEELRIKITSTCLFARIVPEQKLRIVKALKANGEIVAMTGDGVNDAPALKAADIGVAMGNKGTDVARESSSLVLLDDNFASIVSAIRSGRRIFDNLQKAMSYILAIHIPIIGLTLLPAFLSFLPMLLMPLHIIFMELIVDPVSSVAFETEQEEKRIMQRPPRNPEEKFFGMQKILFSVLEGLLLLAMVTTVYFLSLGEGHSDGEVRAITFSSLIIGNVFLVLTNLSKTRSFVSVFTEKNVAAILIFTLAIGALLVILAVPVIRETFNFEFPGYRHFYISLLASGAMLLILETIKFFRNRTAYSFT